MLLELISRYYKLLWWGLIGIALIKVILSYSFHGSVKGLYGIVYSVFNWYGEDEKEREENASRLTLINLLNLATFAVYTIIFIIIMASLMLMVLGR